MGWWIFSFFDTLKVVDNQLVIILSDQIMDNALIYNTLA